ncbi:type III-B CRISPR module-associated protein Cmr5 [Myxococcota bacterium]|nr:type III-B CRISPR module-associated protein Cmr5 [Myxococcota bacterium]
MTRQQQWSLGAHQAVLSFKGSPLESKLNTHCQKSPSLFQQSGVVQTLAFLESRGEHGVTFCNALAQVYKGKDIKQLLEDAQKAKLPDYLAMSRDLIEVAAWFRRFAQIELGDVTEEAR